MQHRVFQDHVGAVYATLLVRTGLRVVWVVTLERGVMARGLIYWRTVWIAQFAE